MIDRRLLTHFDWLTLSLTLALTLTGIATVYSATHSHQPAIYRKELYWAATGALALIVAAALNYSLVERFAYAFYGATLALLASVFFIGSTMGGARRWIHLGAFSVQPSEAAKLALIVALARYFSARPVPREGMEIKALAAPALLLAAPFLMIARQPDLGTAIILWMIFWSMVLVVKVRARVLAGVVLSCAAVFPLAWRSLKGYQKARLTSFLDPGSDPLGSGYHLLQSKIAIGSGGVIGKGFTKGTQGKLMFLPEHHTDFIFSVLAEEWGLIGSLTVLGLFLGLVFRGLHTANDAKDRFGYLMALGITSMFFWHAAINLGMVTGMLPVVGVPLPFVSYGGSFLVTSMTAAGLIINIRMRRFIF
jgi:rod shape determining protein RodA